MSLTTSISYSFQPIIDSSINTEFTGDASRPLVTILSNSSLLYAIPPPVPPKVKEGLIIRGRPISFNASSASFLFSARTPLGVIKPIFIIADLKSSLSSAFFIALRDAPISSTLYFLRVPDSAKSIAVLRAVCPPIVGNRASGFSFIIIFLTISGVIGSMYVASAKSGSVIIVAGLELIKIILYPSSFNILHACEPE